MDEAHTNHGLVYAGFWIRVWASIIDSVLVMIVLYPLQGLLPGLSEHATSGYLNSRNLLSQSILNQPIQMNWHALVFQMFGPWYVMLSWAGVTAIIVVLFWVARLATPGKMAIGARIVDAGTGEKPSSGRYIVRYLGYFVSIIPFFLGLIWVGIDPRKQGWHDKLARTVVVRDRDRALATAQFDNDPHNGNSGRGKRWNP